MQTPWSKYFRLGVVHFMAYPEVAKDESRMLPTIAAIAADADFEVIELRGVKDPALRPQIRALCESAHLTVAYGAQPIVLGEKLNPNSLDADERAHALARLKEAVNEAVELGAKGFAFLSGRDPGEANREKAQEGFEELLVELCEYAAEKDNLPVVLEVFDRDIDKKAFVGPTAFAAEIARNVREKCDNFGLMLDLSHIPMLYETVEESLTAAREYVRHVHAGNCVIRDSSHPAYGDLHPRFGIEGGENDVDELTEYLRWLFSIGYLAEDRKERPICSFEVQPMSGESSEAVLAGAKRTLTAAWAKLEL
ncbi:MAG: sugar phosphate isomerase/epimerase family protein [Limnochordia bacterium]